MNKPSHAVTEVQSEADARDLLLSAGLEAMGKRSGYIPLQTTDSLPKTEQAFSEETRSSRKTRDIRIKHWLNHLNVKSATDYRLMSFEEIKQVEFVTFKKYLLFEPLEDFVEILKNETEELPWLEKAANDE